MRLHLEGRLTELAGHHPEVPLVPFGRWVGDLEGGHLTIRPLGNAADPLAAAKDFLFHF